jgi:hypothetical protein
MGEFKLSDHVQQDLWSYGEPVRGKSVEELIENTKWKKSSGVIGFFMPKTRFAMALGDTIHVNPPYDKKLSDIYSRPERYEIAKAFHELVHRAQFMDKGVFMFLVEYIANTIYKFNWRKTKIEQEAFENEYRFLRRAGYSEEIALWYTYGKHRPKKIPEWEGW